jgi:hypothetical protein
MKTYLLIIAIFFASCGSGSQQKKVDISGLKDEVIAIHDEVMPKMGELRKVEKELNMKAQADTSAVHLIEAADRIGEANASMMQWMRGYEPEYEGTEEEIVQYLNDQKASIQQVKEDMLTSLAEGKKLLEDK